MSYLRTDKGFTLVELVIVIAISSLVLVGILAGQGAIQRRTEFSSAIDATRLQLKAVQNEATQSVAVRTGGGTSDETNFGKLIELNSSTPAAATQMKTWTLVEDAAKTSLFKCDEHDTTLNQAVSFVNATNGATNTTTEAIVFGRNPNQTYVIPNFLDPQGGAVPAVCTPSAAPTPVIPTPGVNNCSITQNNPVGTCVTPPPPPVPLDCSGSNSDPAYQCGLYGQYYKGTTINGPPNSAFIDAQVGTNLGNGASSFPAFAPTLTGRAQAPARGVAVDWSGQIRLGNESGDVPTPQEHTYCFSGDQGSTATITVGATVYTLTGNLGAPTPPANSCQSIQVPKGDWYNIHIQYAHTGGGTPAARLYEQSQTGPIEIFNADLRTSINNHPIAPPSAFANGLYGQYYSDVNQGNRVSAYTDPLIGDGGIKFSFNTANGFADTDPIVFVPTLLWNTASNNVTNKSVKWTGQILVDTAGTQTYCADSDDGARIIIDGTTVQSAGYGTIQATTRHCGTANLTTGWHNLEVDYQNTCCIAGNGGNAVVRLVQLNAAGSYVEVAHDHLRRPLDWSAAGTTGACDSAQPFCLHSGNLIAENVSSAPTGMNVTCGNSNHAGQITYTKSGLTPDSTYNMDISYFNEPNGTMPAPPGYSYSVCVAVNGTVLNGGNPVPLPISEPSLNPRTYTMNGITVPASGNVTVTLDWLNDAYQPHNDFLCWTFGIFCGYDANFGVSRLDLYRTLNAAGQLSTAPPKPATPTAMVPASLSSQTLAARLLNLFLPTAHAGLVVNGGGGGGSGSSCTTNILDPKNYTTNCFGAGSVSTLNLQVTGDTGQGAIDVSTQDGSIERRITN